MENTINQGTQILDFLLRPAVEYNCPANKYWGVSFHEGKAYVASELFCICVEGFKDIIPEDEFFSFFEGKYGKIPYKISIKEIISTIHGFPFVGKAIFPINNLINRLDCLSEKDRHKSRTVFTQGIKETGDALLKFKHNGQRFEFTSNKLSKPIYVDLDESRIPEQRIVSNQVYKCKVRETDSCILANVIEPYGKVRAGVIFSQNGFDPDNIEAVNRLIDVPQEAILTSNTCEFANNVTMPPIHLDSTMLYDLLKVFLATNSQYVEFHFGDDPNKHVMLRNIKLNPDDLQVSVYVATLNPFYGIQRR